MWPFKQKPKGPQYTEEERRRRGFVEYDVVMISPANMESHEVQAQMIIARMIISGRSTPMGGPVS